MATVIPQESGNNTATTSTKKESRVTPRYTSKQKKYERFFDFIDPLKSLQEGLYKYKDETDRKILEILSDKLHKSYGPDAQFKDTASVLKYVWQIEDGEPVSSLEIEKADLYAPCEESMEVEEPTSPSKTIEERRKHNEENRVHLGSKRTTSVKAPNLEYTCKVCMDQAVSMTFIPCGHLVVCGACAPALGDCPVCRQTIKGTISTKF